MEFPPCVEIADILLDFVMGSALDSRWDNVLGRVGLAASALYGPEETIL